MKRWAECSALLLVVCASLASAAEFTGKVVDQDGEPVADATVWLFYPHANGEFTWGLAATGTTAEDGSFSLEDPDHDPPLPEQHQWILCAFKEGLAVESVETDDPAEPVELQLVAPAVVTGKILDEDGGPLAGALVTIGSAWTGDAGDGPTRWLLVPDEVKTASGARTDDTGAFELRAVPKGWGASFDISVEGYCPISVVGDKALSALSALRLERSGSLSGRIVGVEEPRVLAGARIALSGHLRDGSVAATRGAEADANGRFSSPGLLPGSYNLWIGQQPGPEYHVRGKQRVEVRPQGRDRILPSRAEVGKRGTSCLGGLKVCAPWISNT